MLSQIKRFAKPLTTPFYLVTALTGLALIVQGDGHTGLGLLLIAPCAIHLWKTRRALVIALGIVATLTVPVYLTGTENGQSQFAFAAHLFQNDTPRTPRVLGVPPQVVVTPLESTVDM